MALSAYNLPSLFLSLPVSLTMKGVSMSIIKMTFPADLPDRTYDKLCKVISENCHTYTETECDEENSLTFIATGCNYYMERRVRDVFNCQANVWEVKSLHRS